MQGTIVTRKSAVNFVLSICVVAQALGSGPAGASEGLAQLSTYMCDPESLTERLIISCSTRFPELSRQAATVLNSWRVRNHSEAERFAEECRQGVEKEAGSQEEIDKRHANVEAAKSQWLSGLTNEVFAKGIKGCREILRKIDSGRDDLFVHRQYEIGPSGRER